MRAVEFSVAVELNPSDAMGMKVLGGSQPGVLVEVDPSGIVGRACGGRLQSGDAILVSWNGEAVLHAEELKRKMDGACGTIELRFMEASEQSC